MSGGGGLRVLTGGLRSGQLIIIMLMGRQRILYSASRLLPVRDQGWRPGGKEGVSEDDMWAAILICSGEVFKLWGPCYYTLPQSRLCNALFAMPGLDFADGN